MNYWTDAAPNPVPLPAYSSANDTLLALDFDIYTVCMSVNGFVFVFVFVCASVCACVRACACVRTCIACVRVCVRMCAYVCARCSQNFAHALTLCHLCIIFR